jgi:tellurite methyltransferase
VSADSSRYGQSLRASYAWRSRGRRPNALAVKAVSILGRSNGIALDIGAGSLSSSRHLLSAGFVVDAIDTNPYTLEVAAELNDPRLHVQCADVRDVAIAQGRYDLIVAVHVIHLIPRRDLETLLAKLARGLTDGGVLCITFLGVRDSWARSPRPVTVLPWNEVLNLTPELEAIWLDELEYDGASILGEPKHWHTLGCLLRKPAS